MNPSELLQFPTPGRHLLMVRGDTLEFKLSLAAPRKGTAWVRTNIGHAEVSRSEKIAAVRQNVPPLGEDWFDIAMRPIDERTFLARLPLTEVGHFEAKCFFLGKNASNPTWPPGPNTVVNVEPTDTCCGNIIYNAFVRQFGAAKAAAVPDPARQECIQALDAAGYTVIPESGKFRDLIKELDFILGTLGCRILQLLPVHPVPTTYGRMGRFGSPYAALSFAAVDPALAEFDHRSTPLEQFVELVDAVHAHNAKILIDIVLNHTGWAAALHRTHPEWLVRGPDGRIEVPGAWGVRWEDLTKLDYRHKDLWQYMAGVFLAWCRRGVDGFRCDAGYMIPAAAWKYIVAVVRQQFPETIFLLEGLGGPMAVTRELLDSVNFNWAYSELFQNYDRGQIEGYLPGAIAISETDGLCVHFAETHDNLRLASRSPRYARMRTALCALFCHQGAFGFANGVEWYATERIDVHGAASLNWGAAENQIDLIRRLNTILKAHPAFSCHTHLELIQQGGGNALALLRRHLPSGRELLVLANLDQENKNQVSWQASRTGIGQAACLDLVSGRSVRISRLKELAACGLEPGQVLCLTAEAADIDLVDATLGAHAALPEAIRQQRLRAKVLEVFVYYNGICDLADFDPEVSGASLQQDPVEFCRRLDPGGKVPGVIRWRFPQDTKREVMIPPDTFLLVQAAASFRAQVLEESRVLRFEESLRRADGTSFALLAPLPAPEDHRRLTLKMTLYDPDGCQHIEAPLLLLAEPMRATVRSCFKRSDLENGAALLLQTNGRGAMLRAPLRWAELRSRYDALLAANLNPEYPEDRRMLLARYRIWQVFQGYSQEIKFDCFHSFRLAPDSGGCWRFHVPAGQGQHTVLSVELEMTAGQNEVRMTVSRRPAAERPSRLRDDNPVRLIVRPDIENRGFHETTKAYTGPETLFPQAITAYPDRFVFAALPAYPLEVTASRGEFVREPEWQYMVHRALEDERGLDPDSDLFSPGYFRCELKGGERLELKARVADSGPQTGTAAAGPQPRSGVRSGQAAPPEPIERLKTALDQYLVRRADFKTVIAGYPWFLDWGRDALIFTRGLIAAGRTADARLILKLFGQYEENGTLPNMIRGADAGNRDTSDAILWFFTGCADLIETEGREAFLQEPCGYRTVRSILISAAQALVSGTPNGIRMDPDSALIFSPAHFTWMDTDYPAGTPRQGYPIEIQALWLAALALLIRIDAAGKANWRELAEKARASLMALFRLEEGYLSDCLYAQPGQGARQGERDDALRPNQLLAVTLGAVDDETTAGGILSACEELLVPGAVRSLADRPLKRALPIVHQGRLLNDPQRPYQGRYQGDEDRQRKPAYHNGTAWTWLFPSFCEAWAQVYGERARKTALAWLAGSSLLLERGCLGHLPEILDGDFPHTPRGCDAQAWGASEWVRVWLKLTAENHNPN